jgi:hypothetical protein
MFTLPPLPYPMDGPAPAISRALDEVVKSQGIRVLDVFVIGPLMVWGGLKLRREHAAGGALLALFGVATVLYNARNYRRIEAARSTP